MMKLYLKIPYILRQFPTFNTQTMHDNSEIGEWYEWYLSLLINEEQYNLNTSIIHTMSNNLYDWNK